jgi:hypothetical protein
MQRQVRAAPRMGHHCPASGVQHVLDMGTVIQHDGTLHGQAGTLLLDGCGGFQGSAPH